MAEPEAQRIATKVAMQDWQAQKVDIKAALNCACVVVANTKSLSCDGGARQADRGGWGARLQKGDDIAHPFCVEVVGESRHVVAAV